MTSVAHRVYRTITFETIVVDDDDYIDEVISNESELLQNLSLKDLIKNKKYEIVNDIVDNDYIESWDNEDNGDE